MAASFHLKAAKALDPLKQGDFAQLCSLYSVLNAVRLAIYPAQLSRPHVKALFQAGIGHLARHRSLVPTFEDGLDYRRWIQLTRLLLKHVGERHGHYLRCEPLLVRHHRKDSEGAFATLERSISAGYPVLMGLWGAHSHYTVLAGISASRLTFFDSTDLHWVRRDCCSFMHSGHRLRHRISRHSIFALMPNAPESG